MSFVPELEASAFSITRHSLTVGVEPLDAVRGLRAASRFDVAFDVPALKPLPPLAPARLPSGLESMWAARDDLQRLHRHESGRYSVIDHPLKPLPEPLRLRLGDDSRRFVPRRFTVDYTQLPVVVRPHLFPGATYPHPSRATGVRGLLRHGGDPLKPARWARVTARSNGQSVGFAHGDDRGEFLLLIETPAVTGQLPVSVTVDLEVRTRPAPVVPSNADERAAKQSDALWDLPVERLLSPSDPALLGRASLPELSKLTTVSAVAIPLSKLLSLQIAV